MRVLFLSAERASVVQSFNAILCFFVRLGLSLQDRSSAESLIHWWSEQPLVWLLTTTNSPTD